MIVNRLADTAYGHKHYIEVFRSKDLQEHARRGYIVDQIGHSNF